MTFPKAPKLSPPLRLARLSDLTRVSVIAAAGFFYSNVFPYERPHYAEYVYDTLASYRDMYARAITNPNIIVLVCEDELENDEIEKVYPGLKEIYPSLNLESTTNTSNTSKVIVGVASLSFQANSRRKGQFQPDDPKDILDDPDLRDRDKSPTGCKKFSEALHDLEKRLFVRHMVVDTIVVHPKYWRRGHGTSLIRYFTELAESERVGLGVSAARSGIPLFEKLGYKLAETVEVPGYEEHPKAIELWLGLYKSPKDIQHSYLGNQLWLALSAMLRPIFASSYLAE